MPKPSSQFCMRLGLLGVLLGALVLPLTTQALGPNVPLYVSEELDDKSAVVPLSPQTKALFDYLEDALQFQFEIRRVPWKRAVESAQNGDGMIFGISKTPERLRQLAFSVPIYSEQTLLITRCESNFRFKSLQDLKGQTLGIVRGTSYGEEFDQQKNILFKVEDDTGNTPARFNKLRLGRMDGLLVYSQTHDLAKLELSLNELYSGSQEQRTGKATRQFCVQAKPISSVEIHFAIRPDRDQGLLRQIDKVLQSARTKGDLARIFSPNSKPGK
ncbi:MAG: transporter substrate-binding domain-containing protein [Burkholderiales bacterium]|nr:transporter substrate-binding domain-containing protein [Burkholderiales bacterium]